MMPRKTESEETFVVEAYPQGAKKSGAPVLAVLKTRSFTLADEMARRWAKHFDVIRIRVVSQITQSNRDPLRS